MIIQNSDRDLDGWCDIILGKKVKCTECDWSGYHKNPEPFICPKCGSKIELTNQL